MQAAGLIGHRHVDQLIEATGSQQGWVEQVGPVGGANDHNALQLLQPVHFGQDGILRSGENPKIRGIDDPEVVGDLVAELMPVPGHGFA